MPTKEPPSHILLDNRRFAAWEKLERLAVALYDDNTSWLDNWANASHRLRKIADDVLDVATELDASACDIEAEYKRRDESMAAAGNAITEGIAEIERDKLTDRFIQIAQTSGNPAAVDAGKGPSGAGGTKP